MTTEPPVIKNPVAVALDEHIEATTAQTTAATFTPPNPLQAIVEALKEVKQQKDKLPTLAKQKKVDSLIEQAGKIIERIRKILEPS